MSQKCSERAWLKGQAGENTGLLNKSFVRGVIITTNRSVQRRRGWEDRHRIRSALMSLALQANVGYSCETTRTAKGCLLAWYCSDDKFLSLSWSWFALLAGVFLPHGLHGLGGKKSGTDAMLLRHTGSDCRSGPGGAVLPPAEPALPSQAASLCTAHQQIPVFPQRRNRSKMRSKSWAQQR